MHSASTDVNPSYTCSRANTHGLLPSLLGQEIHQLSQQEALARARVSLTSRFDWQFNIQS